MNLNILIVDDEALARSRLRSLLDACGTAHNVSEAADAAQAMAQLQQTTVDLLLLDIQLPGTDGLALAQTLVALPKPPILVFVSAHCEHAVTAFALDATDYLTKPVRLERLQQALKKVEQTILTNKAKYDNLAHKFLAVQVRGGVERITLDAVLYFKAELKYVTLRTAGHRYILDTSLDELQAQYGPRFMRIHRNTLVACQAICALEKHGDPSEGEGWAVRVTGLPEYLRVSRRQVALVRTAMSGPWPPL